MSREERFLRLRYRILKSSLLLEDPATRWLFLTMLLLGDDAGTGEVDMPVARLAAFAALTLEETARGLERLMAPDPQSHGQLEEGRRVVPLAREAGMEPRGWRIVNWEDLRKDAEREAAAIRKRRSRSVTASHRESHRITPDSDSDSDSDSDKEKKSTSSPADKLAAIWNEHARGKRTRRLSEGRKKAARLRLSEEGDLEVWRAAAKRVGASAFCRGENERGWVADFDWFLRPDTLTHIEEGRYDDRVEAAVERPKVTREDFEKWRALRGKSGTQAAEVPADERGVGADDDLDRR